MRSLSFQKLHAGGKEQKHQKVGEAQKDKDYYRGNHRLSTMEVIQRLTSFSRVQG